MNGRCPVCRFTTTDVESLYGLVQKLKEIGKTIEECIECQGWHAKGKPNWEMLSDLMRSQNSLQEAIHHAERWIAESRKRK